MAGLDILVFVAFVVAVITIGLLKSRTDETKKRGAQDYFLAGRGLTWWLVGFSLIAANISSEQFVGMSGKASDWLGIAIASYEWMAAITLVVVAFLFLPTFLKSGIYTIPEFLEYRYNTFARTIMAISTMIILVGVPTASVIYSGAKVICVFFQGQTLLGLDLGNITVGCWIIGVLAAVYVFVGGLKACAWADLIQGAALILAGVIITYLVFLALGDADPATLAPAVKGLDPASLADKGPLGRFLALNSGDLPAGKLHMFRPADDPEIPWTALIIGMWIPHFFYWGLNQYITQRTLGSKSLDEGQKGIVFAAFLKLIIPFVVVVPGMLAFNLYHNDLDRQAELKNAPVLKEFEDGADKVFVFDRAFAELHPDLTARILSHNERRVTPGDLRPQAPDGAALYAYNETLVARAKAAKVATSEKLVGHDHDAAFPTLLRNLLPRGNGLMGFVLAAIFGAVVSSLASMLNSASTIFTMDIFRKIKKEASEKALVTTGRICTVAFVLIAVFIAPSLDSPKFGGIFTFIQEFQGFISPGILAIFLFGLLVHRAPRMVGTVGLVLNPILYGTFKLTLTSVSFLNRMALCFGIVLAVLTVITVLKPLPKAVTLPVNEAMDLTTSKSTKIWGAGVIVGTILLYIVFF
jgi:solute:Na+ symporter, SSS family